MKRTHCTTREPTRVGGAAIASSAHIRCIGHAAWSSGSVGRVQAPVPAAASARVRVASASRAAILVGLGTDTGRSLLRVRLPVREIE